MFTKIFEFSNINKYQDLINIAKKYDYFTFVNKTDTVALKYNILYRGMSEGNELENNSFMADYVGHAKEYGEYVDGIIVGNEKILYFNNNTFNILRDKFAELLIPNIPKNFDYDEYELKFKKKLNEIYLPYFKQNKLDDAIYSLNFSKKKIIDFVYDFIVDSAEDYIKYSMNKQNDFFIPILMYYANSKGINIISFYGNDFGGTDEYVVNDISKYTKLSDIWKSVN